VASSRAQEDADFLLAWYSGWSNGQAKAHVLNVPRVRESVHDVIAYCKANKDKRVTKAIDLVRKGGGEAGRLFLRECLLTMDSTLRSPHSVVQVEC
jgi:hypothetical protein